MLVAAVSVFLALSGEAAAQVKTLVFCSDESPDSFNPQLTLRQATFDASSRQIYDRLVAYDLDSGQIVPSLATSWRISDDGLTYEFELRQNVAFQSVAGFKPSRTFSAADVVFSFMRQLDPDHPYHKVSGGVYPYFRGLRLRDIIKTVRATGENTVVFELSRPYPPFLAVLTLDFASILSAEYAHAMLAAGTPERVDTDPVGTGPFQLVQYQRDALIRYVANVDYWRGKAPLDNLVFTITPDATVRYQKLRDGECQVMAKPDPADIPSMSLDSDIKLVRQPRMDVGYLAFNTRKWPLHDARVRRALAMAIDRRAILEKVYQGLGRPATGMIPHDLFSQDETPPPPPADPEGAKELLKEAGYAGFQLDIWPSPVSRPYMPDARRVAEMIHEDWKKIGVSSRIIVATGRDFIKQTMVGEQDVALFGWMGETLDPSMFLAPILGCDAVASGANRSFWCNGNFDRLLDEASRSRDPEEKKTLYDLVQAILREDAPVVPIANSIAFAPIRYEVLNYRASPLGGHYFYGVDVK